MSFARGPQQIGQSVARQVKALAWPRQSRAFSSSSIAERNTPARRPRDPLDEAPNAIRHALASGETFIVRPPSSTTSPFYPASSEHISGASSDSQPVSPNGLPALAPAARRRHVARKLDQRLTDAQIEQIRELRRIDPLRNTAGRLARQFKCLPLFISMVAPAPKAKRQREQAKLEEQRSGWGANKTLQRELRKERRSLW